MESTPHYATPVVVLALSGLPGCGKSTLARHIIRSPPPLGAARWCVWHVPFDAVLDSVMAAAEVDASDTDTAASCSTADETPPGVLGSASIDFDPSRWKESRTQAHDLLHRVVRFATAQASHGGAASAAAVLSHEDMAALSDDIASGHVACSVAAHEVFDDQFTHTADTVRVDPVFAASAGDAESVVMAGAMAGAATVATEVTTKATVGVAAGAAGGAAMGAAVRAGGLAGCLHLIIVDDNMWYRSMRLDVFRIARDARTGFIQAFLDTPLEICLTRNAGRSGSARVPEDTIRSMEAVFEPPGASQSGGASWEKQDCIVTLESDCGGCGGRGGGGGGNDAGAAVGQVEEANVDMQPVWKLVTYRAGRPPLAPPAVLTAEQIEEREHDAKVNLENMLHRVDLALRKCMSEIMVEACRGCAGSPPLPKKAKKLLGQEMSALRRRIHSDMRQRPPSAVAVVATTEAGGGGSLDVNREQQGETKATDDVDTDFDDGTPLSATVLGTVEEAVVAMFREEAAPIVLRLQSGAN